VFIHREKNATQGASTKEGRREEGRGSVLRTTPIIWSRVRFDVGVDFRM
jgi:hypothetical protein